MSSNTKVETDLRLLDDHVQLILMQNGSDVKIFLRALEGGPKETKTYREDSTSLKYVKERCDVSE
jgi:hypothetical protein